MTNPEISGKITPHNPLRIIDGHIFIRPTLSDFIPHPSKRTASSIAGIALTLFGFVKAVTPHKVDAYGGGPTPTSIPEGTPSRTPFSTVKLTPTPAETQTHSSPESKADFNAELTRILDLSPNVEMRSTDGSLTVGISKEVMAENGLSGSTLTINPEKMGEISDLLQISLTTIAKARNNGAREINFGTIRAPIGTNVRMDVVDGRPGLQEKGTKPSSTQYGTLKKLFREHGIPFQEFDRLKNNVPYAESFVAFVDQDGALHLVVNGGDYPKLLVGKPEGKIPFWLSCSAALLRRYAIEHQGVDGSDFEKRAKIIVNGGDDIYNKLGCNESNQGCITAPGGVLQIRKLSTPTPTPTSTPLRIQARRTH